VGRVREDFPALAMKVYGKPLVYLDNAASAQKPTAVLDRMTEATKRIRQRHRGPALPRQCRTEAYDGARGKWRNSSTPAAAKRSSSPATSTEAITW